MPYYRKRKSTRRRNSRVGYTRSANKALTTRRSFPLRRKLKYARIPSFRPSWHTVAPQKMRLRFKYADTGYTSALAVGNGYSDTYIFRGNSCFDPDYTGVGVQPYGWDEYCALYGYYVVRASSIKVYYSTSTADTTTPRIIAAVVPSVLSSLAAADPADIQQYHYRRCKSFSNDDSTGRQKIINYCSTKKMFPGMTARDNNFQAAVTANAAANYTWYWHVLFNAADWAQNTTIMWGVKITYYTEMVGPINLNES